MLAVAPLRERANAPWSPRDDSWVIALWTSGSRVGTIAEHLQRTNGAIYDRARSLGLAPRRPVRISKILVTVIEDGIPHRMFRIRLVPVRVSELRGTPIRRSTASQIRQCLRCRLPFASAGAGNRLCAQCHLDIAEMA